MNTKPKKSVRGVLLYKLRWEGSAVNAHRSGHMYFATEKEAQVHDRDTDGRSDITPVVIPSSKVELLRVLNEETGARFPRD